MATSPLRIGTRGSRLALWQATFVADQLRPIAVPRPVEIIEILTAGDRIKDAPLSQVGGEGVFTKEIQRAVLAGDADVAVHSLKDLPTNPVEGLVLAAIPPRGSAGDVFVSKKHRSFDSLPPGAMIATSSPRRRASVLHRRPDLQVVNIRGNVETRLRKYVEEGLDALILAQAGLERLGLADQITEVLDPSWLLPAVGQGALGLECRVDGKANLELVRQLDDLATRQAVTAERSLLFALGGGCQVPIGASARIADGQCTLRASVFQPDGKKRVDGRVTGPAENAESLGRELARDLLSRGAGELFAGAQTNNPNRTL